MCETTNALRHYLGMKAFALSLVLLVLGVASATGQTVAAADRIPAPATLSEKEPSLEAVTPQNGSQVEGSGIEQPRIATRPPTPLVRK